VIVVKSPTAMEPSSSGGSRLGPGGHRPSSLTQVPQIFNWFHSNFA